MFLVVFIPHFQRSPELKKQANIYKELTILIKIGGFWNIFLNN